MSCLKFAQLAELDDEEVAALVRVLVAFHRGFIMFHSLTTCCVLVFVGVCFVVLL